MNELETHQAEARLPPREALPLGFAVQLADRKGVSRRANYTHDQIYQESATPIDEAVLSVSLPDKVNLVGLSGGCLIFDFSANPDYCGGELPGLFTTIPDDDEYRRASERRTALVDRRAKYVNAFLTTLWVGGQQAGVGIGPQRSVHQGNYLTAAQVEGGGWRIHGPGAAAPLGGWPQIDIYLPGDAFRNAGATFAAIHAAFDASTFELLPLLQDCVSAYADHKFSAALVIGWSVAESVLGRRWRTYLDESGVAPKGEAGSKQRRERLLSADFTASVVTEVLALAGRLNERERTSLDVARKSRNEFAHQLKACDPSKALLAASTAAQLIGEDAKTDFRVSNGYAYQV